LAFAHGNDVSHSALGLKSLTHAGTTRRFAAGEVLWTAGAVVNHMLVIIDGQVRVVREAGGRQHVVHTEGPGGTLGEVPFYTGSTAPATAIAVVPTQCLILTRAAIESAIAADPSIAWTLLSRLARRVRTLVDRLDRLALQSTMARLSDFLLDRADANGLVTLGMTQSALAEELGTVREVVVRALRALRDRGIVSPAGPGRLRILDAHALRQPMRKADRPRSSR
jgi:CRP/FNR family transcriptional regulator, cyclic AMP receptor protein